MSTMSVKYIEKVTPRSVNVSDSHVIPRSGQIPFSLSFNEPIQTTLVFSMLMFNPDILAHTCNTDMVLPSEFSEPSNTREVSSAYCDNRNIQHQL